MIELARGSRWITGTEAAVMAGISEATLRQRRSRESADRHPRHVSVGASAVLYRADEFARYVATWTDERQSRQASR